MARRYTLGLLLVSLIWGTTFVAVKSAISHVSPLLFVGARFALATVAALPILFAAWRHGQKASRSLLAGIPLGIVLALAYAAQTQGLVSTTPARSAFVTGLNVALVPFWALLVLRQRPGWLPVLGLALALPGLWLLTSPEGGAWTSGDSWTLVCAVLFALHVALLTRMGASHDPEVLLVSQLAVTAVICLIASPVLETPRFHPTWGLAGVLVLTAVLASTGTTWLQIRCQPRVPAARTAVIFATEPVFAAAFSWIFIREILTSASIAGGALILAGMLLSEFGTGRAVPERS